MATITTTARDGRGNPNRWSAHFNQRNLAITQQDKDLTVIDTATKKPLHGDELVSLRNFFNWHLKQKTDSSTVPTLWTTREVAA